MVRRHLVLLAATGLGLGGTRIASQTPPSPPLAARADYPFPAIPFHRVEIRDAFWKPRIETTRTTTIPYSLQKCEETGRIRNFDRAAGDDSITGYSQYPFDDSDVFKIVEGASYALMSGFDGPGDAAARSELEAKIDALIAKFAAAQQPDGYLYTARSCGVERLADWYGEQRWQVLGRSHELYNVGHLYEAAVAHHRATGKTSLLDLAERSADLVCREFGARDGANQTPPGHQEIELGLIKLFRVTGKREYLDQARRFLEFRGRRERGGFGQYSQDHAPVLEQTEAVGHAVRATYMYAAMTDVAALTDDPAYRQAVQRLWADVVGRKLYVTGGLGATGAGEAYGKPFELPNRSAYAETCAAIAGVLWNHRMFQLFGHGRYIDVLERTLYNGLLSGVSLDGRRFFYPNPLASFEAKRRRPWFGCSCCPSNICRFLPSIGNYVYAQSEDTGYVNLFVTSAVEMDASGGVKVHQVSDYPWNGTVHLTVDQATATEPFELAIRVPGWARDEAVPGGLYHFATTSTQAPRLFLNDEPIPLGLRDGYARIRRQWGRDDKVRLELPMPIRRLRCRDEVEANRGRVALQRGPLVYCAEGVDYAEGRVMGLVVPDDAPLSADSWPEELGGVFAIRGQVHDTVRGPDDELGLSGPDAEVPFVAIPYYAWAHRGARQMAVWLARDPSVAMPAPQPTLAYRSDVHASHNGHLAAAVADQLPLPRRSDDKAMPIFHWWPRLGSTEWIEYRFPEPTRVSECEVYWFHDIGRGACDVPVRWRLLAATKDGFAPVRARGEYGVAKDGFNRVRFEPVRTHAIRLEVELKKDRASGIHEWRVR